MYKKTFPLLVVVSPKVSMAAEPWETPKQSGHGFQGSTQPLDQGMDA